MHEEKDIAFSATSHGLGDTMKASFSIVAGIWLAYLTAGCIDRAPRSQPGTGDQNYAVATVNSYFKRQYPESFKHYALSRVEDRKENNEWAVLYQGSQLDQWVCFFLSRTNHNIRVVARNFLDPNYKE